MNSVYYPSEMPIPPKIRSFSSKMSISDSICLIGEVGGIKYRKHWHGAWHITSVDAAAAANYYIIYYYWQIPTKKNMGQGHKQMTSNTKSLWRFLKLNIIIMKT